MVIAMSSKTFDCFDLGRESCRIEKSGFEMKQKQEELDLCKDLMQEGMIRWTMFLG